MADEPQTGAMIALIPTEEDAARLVLPGGEKADDLHVTLVYWADGVGLEAGYKLELHRAAISIAANFPPIEGEAFGASVFNPDESPCIVLEVNGPDISLVRSGLTEMIGTGDTPLPWNAHLTLKYGNGTVNAALDRLGPITFDRIRVAIGDTVTDYPLSGASYDAPLPEAVAPMPEDAEPVQAADCGCDAVTAAVNTKTWSSLPVAPREYQWSADDAIVRISAWAGGDANKFGRPFLWKASNGQPLNPESYRLPIADVINGKLTLIPRAVFQAATILSGGHGYLEGVVTDAERDALKATVTEIYAALQKLYQDPRVVAPWLRGRNPDERQKEADNMTSSIIASVNSSGWSSMPIADAAHGWDGGGARGRVREWADGDMRKYRRAFIWWDEGSPENFGSYKLPIADVIDGTLTIIPKAVAAALGAINGARGGVAIPDADMSAARSVLERIQKRIDGGSDDSSNSTTASAAPVAPPREWFNEPQMDGPEPLTVTADGRVSGLLAAWNVCHAGIQDRCVLAPKSRTGYKYFRNGDVLTADGSMVRVGRLTVGTGHADARLGWIPAADHYDNTGTAVAIVAAGENRFGIWVAGAVVSDATEAQVAALRRSPLSGDWRRTPEGGLELVAALAVNTPGFPIISRTASGEPQSLVAAGLVLPEGVEFDEEHLAAAAAARARVDTIINMVDSVLGSERARRFHLAMNKVKG